METYLDANMETNMEAVVEADPEAAGEKEPGKRRWNVRSIFTKKHLVLGSLIVVLGVAVYLNWVFTKNPEPAVSVGSSSVSESGQHYGDAQQVDAAASVTVYFEEARMNRSVARDTSLTKLENLLANDDITEDDKQLAVEQATILAMNISAESRIENLVKAKGFADCIATVTPGSCTVVVQTDGLLASEAAQIRDIILRECDVDVQNISIDEVN